MSPGDVKVPGAYLAISANDEAAVMACTTFDGSGVRFYFPDDEMYYNPEELVVYEMYGPSNRRQLVETMK